VTTTKETTLVIQFTTDKKSLNKIMLPFVMKKIGRISLVLFVLLAGACAGPRTPGESMAAVQENMREWQREQIAAGKGDYMASVYTPLNAQNYDEAIKACEEIREIRPNDPAIYVVEGYAYDAKGERATAINRFSLAIAADSNRWDAYYLRAYSYGWLRDYSRSLEDFDKVLGNQDGPAQVVQFYNTKAGGNDGSLTEEMMKGIIYGSRATAFNQLGDAARAMESINKAIAYSPDNASLYMSRGQFHLKKGADGPAYNDLERAAELDPGLANAWNQAGGINIRFGSYNKAVVQLQKANEIEPTSPVVLSNLGLAYWLSGDQVKAFEIMGKAMRNEPIHTTYYHAAYFHHVNGRQDKALEYYRKAYELNRDILAVRASKMNATPASSPTRKFYEDELSVATLYIEQAKTPVQIANDSRAPKFEIADININPNPVPVNTAFDFHVSFDVDIPGSPGATIPTVLHFEVLKGSKVLLTSESYSINASNGQTKKWTLHMNPVRTKGSYTIRVFIKYKNLVSEKSTKLLIN